MLVLLKNKAPMVVFIVANRQLFFVEEHTHIDKKARTHNKGSYVKRYERNNMFIDGIYIMVITLGI